MHAFQPFPIELLEINTFTKFSKEWALVSSGTKKNANTMTVSWGGTGVIWGKNVVYIFVRESRYTKELIDAGSFFSVAFLNEEYRDALKYCGVHSGREGDKFEAAELTVAAKHGIPYPDEANLVFLCHKMAAVPITEENFSSVSAANLKEKWYADGDYHTMYIAEIMEVLTR